MPGAWETKILKGKINSAQDLLELAYKMDADHKNIANNRAVLNGLTRNWAGATKILRRLLRDKTHISSAYLYNLAFLYTYIWKKYDVALAFIENLQEFETEMSEVNLLLGDIYFFTNNMKKAIDHWELYRQNGLLRQLAYHRLYEIDYTL